MMILLPTMKNLFSRPNFAFAEIYSNPSLLYCSIMYEETEDTFLLCF